MWLKTNKLKENITDIHDWCFVSGKVNSLETGMFTDEFFELLLNSETPNDTFKYISESKLRNYFTGEEDIYDFERHVDAYFFDSINEIRFLCPAALVCDLFLLRYKFLDFKNFVKNKLMGIPDKSITFYILESSDMENIWKDKEKGIDMLFREQLSDGSEVLNKNVDNLMNILKDNKNFTINDKLWIIDLIMDNAYLCCLSNISRQISIEYVKEYLEKFVFVKVIESLMRTVSSKCNTILLKKYFLQDCLNRIHFLKLLNLSVVNWREILRKELPAEVINTVITDEVEKDRNNLNLIRCEKLLADYLIRIIKPAKYITFGPERVFGYLCGLDVERYNLKLVIGGKVNKIERQSIKDRLRNCYV